MPAILRDLTASARFGLREVSVADPAVLASPVLWAHSSDLPDPTPWLDTNGLLLTDGVQFAGGDPTPAAAYVRRLVSHGVLALGFATGIIHDTIPSALVDAARAGGLTLLEVPRNTPFMAVIRFVSDAVAQDDREVLEKSLRAQRSVARAALRPDGLAEILRELEQNLDCWVVLFDASGTAMKIPTKHSLPVHLDIEVKEAVRRMLDRGRTSAERLSLVSTSAAPDEVTLQSLGAQGHLRGVLAVGTGTGALDRARADLVNAVIALASIALEQSRTLDDARRRLRSGVFELLVAGMTDVARRTVEPVWGELPPDPIRVASIAPPEIGDQGSLMLRSSLDLLANDRSESLFHAEHDSLITVITPADESHDLLEVIERAGGRAGFSAPGTWATLTSTVEEARSALSRSTTERPVNHFDDLARDGLLGHLERTDAETVARRILEPLDASAPQLDLRRTLEVWLENNGGWDPTSKTLGIHRHTLRSRVDTAGALLKLDLNTFAARAEVWSALQLTSHTPARRRRVSRSGGSPG